MREAADSSVTVKTRIGIDDRDDYAFIENFVDAVAQAGCDHFVVHARKAILAGLSPKENRSIPAVALRRRLPLEAGLSATDRGPQRRCRDDRGHSRASRTCRWRHDRPQGYADPWFLTELDDASAAALAREHVVAEMADYAGRQIAAGARLHHVTRHMLGLFNGRPGARRWRRFLSERAIQPDADEQVLRDSLSVFDRAA